MRVLKTILRWIAVGPSWLLGCIVASVLWSLTACQANPLLFDDLSRDTAGFGGHYLLGPVSIGIRSFVSGFVGMVAVAVVAPAAKREASFVVASILATLAMVVCVMAAHQWRTGIIYGEEAARAMLEAIPGAVAGFIVAARVPHGVSDKELCEGDYLNAP